jgi:hypothetical protein
MRFNIVKHFAGAVSPQPTSKAPIAMPFDLHGWQSMVSLAHDFLALSPASNRRFLASKMAKMCYE